MSDHKECKCIRTTGSIAFIPECPKHGFGILKPTEPDYHQRFRDFVNRHRSALVGFCYKDILAFVDEVVAEVRGSRQMLIVDTNGDPPQALLNEMEKQRQEARAEERKHLVGVIENLRRTDVTQMNDDHVYDEALDDVLSLLNPPKVEERRKCNAGHVGCDATHLDLMPRPELPKETIVCFMCQEKIPEDEMKAHAKDVHGYENKPKETEHFAGWKDTTVAPRPQGDAGKEFWDRFNFKDFCKKADKVREIRSQGEGKECEGHETPDYNGDREIFPNCQLCNPS